MATRLTEDPNVTVLLLEAGPIDNDEPWVRIPFFAGQGVGSTYDWNLMTVPQNSLDGQARAIPQGRALGGGSIINAMLWNRGGIEDFNDWQRLGNPGWSWPELLPYFVKVWSKTTLSKGKDLRVFRMLEAPSVDSIYGPEIFAFV